MQAEVVESARAVDLCDAVPEPADEIPGYQLAPFGAGGLGVEHLDDGFILLELLDIASNVFLPADQFILEAPDLAGFVPFLAAPVALRGNIELFHHRLGVFRD